MENSTIRGRFSLSTTNLTSPIAESTCLNGVSSRSKFNWGEGTIGSSSRNNSHSLIEQNNSMSNNSKPTKVSMSPSSRIDRRTYVDIHSNGLASRIVKYHDNSSRLNRSLSMTNLYNKPGQFPVVHLKKNETQYKVKKTKNLSMTRIAAPEKSVFHGNTLSSILRSGSIVGLQKSDEEISRENRPILHPPPTENEMAPTRSVLEVLKEISRKRINSDEMDGTELTKKQCKESEQDASSNNTHRTQSKRQREITNTSACNSQISPEQQVIKKRMCNYNNDIMSSLSSSMASVNKRKMLEIQSQKRSSYDVGNHSSSSSSATGHELPYTDKQRRIGNLDEQNSNHSTKNPPTVSISNVTLPTVSDLDGDIRNGIVTRRASEPVLSINTKPKVTLFNKDYDEVPTINHEIAEAKNDGDLCGIQFVKPKKSSSISSGGSLLMEKTKKSKLALMLSGLKGELDEEDEVDTPPPNKEQQSTNPAVTTASNVSSSTSLSTTTAATTKESTTQPSITSNPVETKSSENKQSEVSSSLSLPAVSVTSTVSSGFKINPLPSLSTTSSTPAEPASTPAITTSASVSSINLTPTSSANAGFSFGLSVPKTTATTPSSTLVLPSTKVSEPNTSTTTTSATIPVLSTNSITGIKPFGFGTTTTQPSASSTTTFSFGAPTSTSQVDSSTKEPTTSSGSSLPKAKELPAFGQSSTSSIPTFSFGSLAEAKTTANTMTTQTASPGTAIGGLTTNIDSQKTTWTIPSNPTPQTNSGTLSVFGAGSLSTLPQTTKAPQTTTNSTGGFSFGNSLSTEVAKPLFGTTTTTMSSNTTFSFSTNKTTPNPANSQSTFTFGTAGSSPSSAALPNASLSFGSTAAAPAMTINPPNVFGSSQNPKPSNTFTFGSTGPSAPAQNGLFSFSSSDKSAAAAPPPAGSSVGGFSFNSSSVSLGAATEPNKNIFGSVAPAANESKPAFNFGSSATNQNNEKPVTFGGSANIFGSNVAPSTAQSPAFTFGSSANEKTNQQTAIAPNPFAPAATSNLSNSLGAAPSNSIFGAPSAAVAPLAQSSTFNFGASSNNTKLETSNSTGGFVFGSSSAIGNNASKPAVDLNKTFVFGDGNTIIKPAPSTANVFGGGNSGTNNVTENKVFSFGAAAGSSNNTFAAPSQTVNPVPAFNFGGVQPANNSTLLPNGQPGQQQMNRPIKKATRRLHKT